jgi:hypothetical protein
VQVSTESGQTHDAGHAGVLALGVLSCGAAQLARLGISEEEARGYADTVSSLHIFAVK